METPSIRATEDEAVAHLIEFWRRIAEGTSYPGYPGDAFGAEIRDVLLLKVRFRDTNGDKYGALVGVPADAPVDFPAVAKRVGAHFDLPVEYATTQRHATPWISIPHPRIAESESESE